MGAIGPTQVILIVLVVLLMFGGRKIPELMRGLGRGVKEFKDATQDDGKSGDDADKGLRADSALRTRGPPFVRWRRLDGLRSMGLSARRHFGTRFRGFFAVVDTGAEFGEG